MSPVRQRSSCVSRSLPAFLCGGLAVLAVAPTLLVPSISAAHTRASDSDRQLTEYEIKAHLIARFVRYTRWPESAFESKDAPFVVAVLGKDPFDDALDNAFKDVKVGERKVKVVRGNEIAALGNPQLLFVVGKDEKQQHKLVEQFMRKPLLLVTDTLHGAELGAHFGFYLEGKRVRFAANTASAKRSSLEISSELLKHAKIVSSGALEGGESK